MQLDCGLDCDDKPSITLCHLKVPTSHKQLAHKGVSKKKQSIRNGLNSPAVCCPNLLKNSQTKGLPLEYQTYLSLVFKPPLYWTSQVGIQTQPLIAVITFNDEGDIVFRVCKTVGGCKSCTCTGVAAQSQPLVVCKWNKLNRISSLDNIIFLSFFTFSYSRTYY